MGGTAVDTVEHLKEFRVDVQLQIEFVDDSFDEEDNADLRAKFLVEILREQMLDGCLEEERDEVIAVASREDSFNDCLKFVDEPVEDDLGYDLKLRWRRGSRFLLQLSV